MSIKSVGIITFYYNNINFGGLLQAFALQKYVSDLGFDCKQICFDYHNTRRSASFFIRILKKVAKALLSFNNNKGHQKIDKRDSLWENDKQHVEERTIAFRKFTESIPHTNKVYYCDTIQKVTNEFDCFICGGDQVWNDWHWNKSITDAFTLNFVPCSKVKFSYAVSIPSNQYDMTFLKELGEGVSQLDAVSVREPSSVQLVQPLTKKSVTAVVDPVLLITAKQWREAISKTVSNIIHKPFILCYFLGNTADILDSAIDYAKMNNCIAYVFPFQGSLSEKQFESHVVRDYKSGPLEFLSLLDKADLVLTNSFHATVFSILFHKRFYSIELQRCNNRIRDLLDQYHLADRKISSVADIDDIAPDYTFADDVMKLNIADSQRFIKELLYDEDSE